MSDALGAFFGIYLVYVLALVNSLVRTFRLTNVTIDTVVRYHQRHY